VFGVAAIGLIVTLGLVLVAVVAAVSVRIETETAADAAALAAVAAAVEGRQPGRAAAEVAAANGARLVRCRCPRFSGPSFVATVTVARDVRLPFLGERRIEVERAAEYAMGP
jgi:hypothetical protein